MIFHPGDRVHFAGLGTGIVREVRSGGRYLIEIKGRAVIAAGSQLEPATAARRPATARMGERQAVDHSAQRASASPSLDLHGKTTAEADEALEVFINDALLAGAGQVQVIHGRSGGRLKAAVHRYLRQLPAVAKAHVDPHNPGVTIVTFR